MSAPENFGEYTLSARRQGEGLLLRVRGDLRPASARSLHRALRAICCEEESRQIDVTLDLAELKLGSDEVTSELTLAVNEMLTDTRVVTVCCVPRSLADRFQDMVPAGLRLLETRPGAAGAADA